MEGGSSVHDTILLLADKKPSQAPTHKTLHESQ